MTSSAGCQIPPPASQPEERPGNTSRVLATTYADHSDDSARLGSLRNDVRRRVRATPSAERSRYERRRRMAARCKDSTDHTAYVNAEDGASSADCLSAWNRNPHNAHSQDVRL